MRCGTRLLQELRPLTAHYHDDAENPVKFLCGPHQPHMPSTRRRLSITILPLVIAVAFAASQYFGAEAVTVPEKGGIARHTLSPQQERVLRLHGCSEIVVQSNLGSIAGAFAPRALRRTSCLV